MEASLRWSETLFCDRPVEAAGGRTRMAAARTGGGGLRL